MTMMRIISRLILRKSSQSSPPRWVSTVTKPAAAEDASAEAPQQPPPEAPQQLSKRRLQKVLFNEVVKNSSESRIPEILDKWVDEGKQVKKVIIGNLLHYFRNRKNFHAALQLYEWMDSSNLTMSNADRAIRIDLLCRVEGVASAEKYFNSLHLSEKTNETYGALLGCYCRDRVFDKALEIFDQTKALNFITSLNYSNVLLLCCNLEQHEKAASLLQEMEEKNIAPNLRTFNLLITSQSAMKFIDALEVLKIMKRNGTKPDFITYEKLATIYIDSGLHEKANAVLELIEHIEVENVEGAVEGCHIRLKLYSMMKDSSGVDRVWEVIKSASPTPSNNSYFAMLLSLSKLGDKENLEKMYKEWEEGCSTYDFRLPNVVLEYYLGNNMIEEANSLYKRLESRAGEANLKALDLFANLCIKNCQIDLALNYLEMGLDKSKSWNKWFPTDGTIKSFSSYFEANSDTDRAEKFYQIMKKHNRLDSDNTKQ